MRHKKLLACALGAAVITAIFRIMVFGDDCNLLVVALTFLTMWTALYCVTFAARALRK